MEIGMVGQDQTENSWAKSWSTGQSSEVLEAIGQIIVFGGMIDGAVCAMFWKYGNIDPAVSRIITGELKTPQMMTMIVRIATARKLDREIVEDLTDLNREMKEISEIRNRLAHGEWSGHSVIRLLTAKSDLTQPVHEFSHEKLREIALRFCIVMHRLTVHMTPDGEYCPSRDFLRSVSRLP